MKLSGHIENGRALSRFIVRGRLNEIREKLFKFKKIREHALGSFSENNQM